MKHKDTIFHNEEQVPEIKACLMHPGAASELTVRDERTNETFDGLYYGLCKNCADESEVNPTYQAAIDLELEKRLNNLRENIKH